MPTRCMTTVVQSSGGEVGVPSGIIITSGATSATAVPAPAPATVEVVRQPVVERVKVVKSEPTPREFTPPPAKKSGGGIRARIMWFFVGFTAATLGGMTWLRADLLQAVANVESHTAPVGTALSARIARLEKRLEEVEAAASAANKEVAPKKK